MSDRNGFWSGMPANIKVRFVAGLAYLGLSLGVLSQAPIPGIVLLVLPILWTVFVIWIGSESGTGFGPYSQRRETAFTYSLRHIWNASLLTRAVLLGMICAAVVAGLGWISTEKLRAEVAKPTLTERVVTAAETASDATKEKASGWFAKAKGWFTSDEEDQSSP